MRKLIIANLLCFIVNCAQAKDEEIKVSNWSNNISGLLNLTTNYVFRGISQTTNYPAVQGGLTYAFPIGAYLNVWGSNVDFIAPNGSAATMELDTVAGWRGDFNNFAFDLNLARYNYPGARYATYNEINSLFYYHWFQIGISYTTNYNGTHASGLYTTGAINLDIPSRYIMNIQNVTFQAEIGHYGLNKSAGNSYDCYSLTINKKINRTYSITAQWTGTNGKAKLPPTDHGHLIGTVTASF